mmetsp:Transcript_9803/g.26123  ORF Transcript_9803/g.26123 Transcript_9803/m.26123 type:complete len:342 (-) Transcript_9803:421-1446(-)
MVPWSARWTQDRRRTKRSCRTSFSPRASPGRPQRPHSSLLQPRRFPTWLRFQQDAAAQIFRSSPQSQNPLPESPCASLLHHGLHARDARLRRAPLRLRSSAQPRLLLSPRSHPRPHVRLRCLLPPFQSAKAHRASTHSAPLLPELLPPCPLSRSHFRSFVLHRQLLPHSPSLSSPSRRSSQLLFLQIRPPPADQPSPSIPPHSPTPSSPRRSLSPPISTTTAPACCCCCCRQRHCSPSTRRLPRSYAPLSPAASEPAAASAAAMAAAAAAVSAQDGRLRAMAAEAEVATRQPAARCLAAPQTPSSAAAQMAAQACAVAAVDAATAERATAVARETQAGTAE